MRRPLLLAPMPLLLVAWLAAAVQAAPQLDVPDGQPGQSACLTGRQPGRQAAGNGLLIESSFEATGWSGALSVRALAIGAGGAIEIGATPLWEAGALLGAGAAAQRHIYTLVRTPDRTLPFTWEGLPAAERAWLDADGQGAARLAYLRGERGGEIGQPGGVFRRRAGILGDAPRGVPLLVGAPSVAGQGPGYAAFHQRYKARAGAIYLGANDGMLHAFAARDGAELFAYVPNALLPALAQLSEPDYRHRPYVDASAGQGEALVGGAWRSVLVSGMGMGARGVFALDISDPQAFGGALWEFSGTDDPAIGHVGAAPQVAKLQVGSARGVPQYRYFAVVPSGVNNYGTGTGRTDAGGALFLLALDKPATERWKEGANYYKLDAPAAQPTQANALAAPALVAGADGSTRYAYAGDLQGRLWRFDFSGKPPYSSHAVFTARDDDGRRQPITEAPRVVFAPGGGHLVLFGTGKLIEDADLEPSGFAAQSFYAVRDPSDAAGRADLARRTLSGDTDVVVKGDEFAYSGAGAKQGWYFDFPQSRTDGERLAASAVLAGGAVFVTSIVPGRVACAAPATRTYALDTLSGFAFNAAGVAVSDAATGTLTHAAPGTLPLLLELGAVTGARGATGGAGAVRTIGVLHLNGDAAAPTAEQIAIHLPARRLSWREIANWQELHDAATKQPRSER